MFGRICVFIDFLIHYADPKFLSKIDLTKVQLSPTHYIGKDGDERIIDLVFQCPLKNGIGNLMAVIIFEHQSGSLKNIPRKLLKYISAIWDAEAKEGKPLSVPYFIVLRTGKKPHKGPFPKISDGWPKDENGNPIGTAIDVAYDVVDLSKWNFSDLVGGPVLRLSIGILKKMTEGNDDEFPEAMLPLLEISNEGEKIELTKETLEFVAKAMSSHNRRLDATMVNEALKPIFRVEEQTMIRTIFEEKFDEGLAEGIAEGIVIGETRSRAGAEAKMLEEKAETILAFLQARFRKLPKAVERKIRKTRDKVVLDSWVVHAGTCQTIKEFEEAIC